MGCACGGKMTMIFACSGGSDCGELSDRIARKLASAGKGKMFCLSGIGGHVEGIIGRAKQADQIIAIDGCPQLCAKKTLEHAGLSAKAYNLADYGYQKGSTGTGGPQVDEALQKMGL